MIEYPMKRPQRTRISLCIMGVWAILMPGLNAASAQQNKPGAGDKPATSAATESADINKKTPLSPEEQRRADLQADTEKLYRLTQELKAEVAKSNKDTLSVSVVKKAQEIERLAKSIKERSRMR